MEYGYIACIVLVLMLVWYLKYHRIYSDLHKSKKQLDSCIKRVDVIQEELKLFKNAIFEIDSKITKIEKELENAR